MSKFFCWFVKITGFIPFVLFNRPKYYYEDKKAQNRTIKGKAIVMPNHVSIYDFATIMFTFPFRTLRCLVAEIMFNKGKLMAWFLTKLGAIKVDRDAKDFTFVDKGCSVLAKRGVIEIYPEARIPEKDEERPLDFKPSVSMLALLSGAKIIPVAHNGKFLKKERLRVLIGKPIDVETLIDESLDEKAQLDMATKKLQQKIKELTYELQQKTKPKSQKERE